MSEVVNTKGCVSKQTCPYCGAELGLHQMEYENESYGPTDSIWLACGRCQVTWEATLEVVTLRRID